jgi:hypothetical protein
MGLSDAIGGGLISAGGDIAKGILGGKAADKAAKTQLQANRETIAYQREQEAARRGDFEKANTAYQAKWEAWNANRMALLNRYGVDIGSTPAPARPAAPAMAQPAQAPGGRLVQAQQQVGGVPQTGGMPQTGQTLGSLMQGGSIDDVTRSLGSVWNQGRA